MALSKEMHNFEQVSLSDLERMPIAEVNSLTFGVVGLSRDGLVTLYNETESRMAGLPAASVMGNSFFLSVAQCMNNFLVAQRFIDEKEMDVIVPYVLTFRMRPTPVKLRLLQSSQFERSYVLIKR